jgi:hypothetical protein
MAVSVIGEETGGPGENHHTEVSFDIEHGDIITFV